MGDPERKIMVGHKFLKPGKIVICLRGQYAGCKAIIVRTYDEGSDHLPFPHCLIVGIRKYPKKVTKRMSKRKICLRSRVRTFIQWINYRHIMPTRYTVSDLDLRAIIKPEKIPNPLKRRSIKRKVERIVQHRYIERKRNTSGLVFFFKKLRF